MVQQSCSLIFRKFASLLTNGTNEVHAITGRKISNTNYTFEPIGGGLLLPNLEFLSPFGGGRGRIPITRPVLSNLNRIIC